MTKLYIREPFRFHASPGRPGDPEAPGNGISLTDDADRHLRDKIMAVLFTAPGERVNRPRFGAGLNRVVFEGLNELTVSAVEYRISEGLRRDLGDEMLLDGVDIHSEAPRGELIISIRYRRRRDRIPNTMEVVL